MRHCRSCLAVTALAIGSVSGLAAQGSVPQKTAGTRAPATAGESGDAAALAKGWTALAAGRHADAARIADGLVKADLGNHHAIALRIEALAAAEPLRALDAYESWLQSRTEDVFLLNAVARGVLRELASGADLDLRIAALEHLAMAGIRSARVDLDRLRAAGQGSLAADAALARLGNAEAVGRLTTPVNSSAPVDRSGLAAALGSVGPAAIPTLLTLLQSPQGPTRAAATAALGKVGAREAVEQLRALMTDQDPFVRSSAAVALTRLGDQAGQTVVNRMLDSEVPDLRLMAAEAWNGQPGPWVEGIRPLLNNMDGTIRLQAARLIAPVDPAAADRVLSAAAAHENPAIRAEAARAIAESSHYRIVDIAHLRRLLRNADAPVRLHAAAVLLRRSA